MAGKKGQQRVLLGRELDVGAVAAHAPRDQIDLAVAERAPRRRRAMPAEERLHARHQLRRPERLDDVVVGADVQPQHHVRLLPFGGEHEDRHVETVSAHCLADLVAVDRGQHHIEQNQIRLVLQSRVEAGLPVGGHGYLEPMTRKGIGQPAHDGRLVLDQQDARTGHAATPRGGHGTRSAKMLPPPGALSTDTVPRCARITASTMLRPRPTPVAWPDNRESTR